MSPKFDLDAALSSAILERALKSGGLPAKGELPPQALPRLVESVHAVLQPICWAFGPDGRPVGPGRPRRRWWLELQTRIASPCERCLEPVELSISTKRGFEFFESASLADARTEQMSHEEEAQDPDLSEVDFLAPDDASSLKALIEDELLLALPMAPKHPDCRLPGAADSAADHPAGKARAEGQAERARPFAGLKDLLGKPEKPKMP